MNTEIVLTFQNLQDGTELEAVMDGIESLTYERVDSKGFDGVGMAMYILSIGSGVVITQLANVIVSLIKKNEGMRVKIGDTEIAGYSLDDIPKILDHALEYSKSKNRETKNDN